MTSLATVLEGIGLSLYRRFLTLSPCGCLPLGLRIGHSGAGAARRIIPGGGGKRCRPILGQKTLAGYGLLLINRGKDLSTVRWVVMTDYWQSYEHFVPEGIHTQSKAQTYTIEGDHSLFITLTAKAQERQQDHG